MIRGVYRNGYKDDISDCLKIRQSVYEREFQEKAERDEDDKNAVHILLYDEKNDPVGTARLCFDLSGDFRFNYLAVLPESRHKGNADFIMHMLFDRAAQSGAKRLVSNELNHNPEFFAHYGFLKWDGQLIMNLKEYFENHRCRG